MMGDVIDLADHRPHNSGTAQCLACRHKWVATAPVGVVELECPGCHGMTGVFSALCVTGFPQFTCDCGSALFSIDTHGAYCIRCGTRPVYDGRPAA